jgi:N-acetyl-alpha-D-muramate 1-phosphate uridylyltransferase
VEETPKPLIELAGEPFLFHQLRLLARSGVRRVVLCVGHLGEKVEQRTGTERSGIAISYSFDAPGLDGTLGAIRRALPLLGERFLVLYGDTYLRIDYADVTRAWLTSGLPAMMTVLRNDSRWDVSNAEYRKGLVLRYDKRAPTPAMRWIDYGLGALRGDVLSAVPDDERDLSSLYRVLAERSLLAGYEAAERFYEIGTPAALAEADAFLRHGTRAEG